MAWLPPWALGGQCSLLVVVQWQEEELAEFAGECLLVVCMLITWCLHGNSICVLFGQYVVSSQEAKEVIPMSLRATRFLSIDFWRRGIAASAKLRGDRPISGWLEVNFVADNFFLFFDQVQNPTCSQDEPVFIVVVQEHRACSDRNRPAGHCPESHATTSSNRCSPGIQDFSNPCILCQKSEIHPRVIHRKVGGNTHSISETGCNSSIPC